MTRKVIITCAVTGSIHTPTMSPYLPVTPEEIADASIEAAEAGASIIHLHARDPETGRPTPDPDVFMEFLPRIKQSTDAVINITTGGGLGMTVEERVRQRFICEIDVNLQVSFECFPLLQGDFCVRLIFLINTLLSWESLSLRDQYF